MELSRKLALTTLVLCLGGGFAHAEGDLRIASEGDIAEQWVQVTSPTALGYPAQFTERGDNVCLAMGYSIRNDGTTSDFSVLKSWSSSTGAEEPVAGFWDSFAQAGASALSHWQFQPKPGVEAPDTTYTVATLGFQGKDPMDAEMLRERCSVDIHALVARAWGEDQRRNAIVEQQRANYLHASPLRTPNAEIRQERAPSVAVGTDGKPRR
ncbi:MAG: hypothetical protein ACREO4_11095 [Lysobacter sp.]